MRRRIPCVLCSLFLAGVTLACLGRSPRPELYRLDARGVDAAAVASLPELGIAVGPIEFPRYLDRREIVTREGAHRLVPAQRQRWSSSLRNEVQRVVADDLAALLGTSRVAVYPVEPRFPLDWRVLLDVRTFEGSAGRSVTLRVRWALVSGVDGSAVAVEEAVVEQPVASDDWDAFVAAHSASLAVVTRSIAERIAALEP